MTSVYTGIQAFCAIASLFLTLFVACRDTEHMNEEDERQKIAEKMAQPSSIAAWLEREPTGET